MLTLNDRPEVRDLFGWAALRPVKVVYTFRGMDKRKAAVELIITPKSAAA